MSAVVVPESLRDTVLRLLLERIRQERVSGGQALVSEEMRAFLWALSHPYEGTNATASFANETSAPVSGTVLLTTEDIAERMGCSVQYARRVAARGARTKVGRQWLVTEQELDASRRSK